MALEILKCPNCGARAPASFAGAVAACEFCGAVLSGLSLKPSAAPAHAPAPAPVAQEARVEAPRAAAPPSAARFTEAELVALARRRLGSQDSLYFHGSIPRGKLKAAHETHGDSIGRVLVQYDDTLFGGADDGFVLTASALHWKNLTEDPQMLLWEDIDPSSVAPSDGAVTLSHQRIDVVLEEGKPMLAGIARLISDLAAWARGHGPPND